ncbi:MAG: DinB family protein [bacterium]|nr:DinB family protein [bacterium]
MNLLQDSIRDLSGTPAAVSALVVGVSDEDWRRRPTDGSWSLLEIVHHLTDEEHEDFPLRLRLTLQDPAQPWPPIDPPAWVTERAYNEADPATVLHDFVATREANLAWLRDLVEPAWDNTYNHPLAGPLSARRLVRSWRAHDLLHLRQLLRRRWQLLETTSEPGDLDYAGSW